MSPRSGDGPRATRGPAENETSATAKQLDLFPKRSCRQPDAATDGAPLPAERAEWLRLFVAAIARRAKQPGQFTTFEVAAEAQLPEPPHHSMWGVGMGIAHREGLIVSVAATPSLRPRTAKPLVRLWTGAKHAESEGAA